MQEKSYSTPSMSAIPLKYGGIEPPFVISSILKTIIFGILSTIISSHSKLKQSKLTQSLVLTPIENVLGSGASGFNSVSLQL